MVEMIGIEPIVTEVGGFTVPCHTIAAASPLYWSRWQDSNLRFPVPKTGGMNQTILHRVIFGSTDTVRTYDPGINSALLYQLSYCGIVWLRNLELHQELKLMRLLRYYFSIPQ